MAKIGMRELAVALANKRGVVTEDANHFVETFFEVLNDGLHYEKLAKVKGLGTFKVIKVSARKSVDVNTGEAIEIAGRDKITFTPDATLRDLVNRPFAQFDTVVVNDGVDFAEIDERAGDLMLKEIMIMEDEDMEKDTLQVAESEQPTREQPVQSEIPEAPIPEPEAPVAVPEVEEPLEAVVQPSEPEIGEETQLPVGEQPVAETIQPSPAVVSEPRQDISARWEDDRCRAQNEILTQANELLRDQLGHSRVLIRILVAALVVFVLLCCFGAFYMGKQFALRDNRIMHLEAQIGLGEQVVSEGTPASKSTDTTAKEKMAEKKENKKQAPAPVTQAKPAPAEPVKPVATLEAKPAKTEVAPKANSAYDADPRIRTGAYNIIGVDRTVTVKAGQTLASISRTYLGPGMECYVEALNGVKEVKEGQTLKIPKLQIKKKKNL